MIWRNDRNVFSVHSENRKWIIIIEYVLFRSQIFFSTVIFADKKIQDKWIKTWTDSIYFVFENDWFNADIALHWLKNVFHSEIKNLKKRRLFIIDDHTFYVSIEFIEFCWSMKIVSLCFFSHITHYFQSLNVNCFAFLNRFYKQQFDEKNKTNVVHIIKKKFLLFFKQTKKIFFTKKVILTEWTKTDKWNVLDFFTNLLIRRGMGR